VKKKGIIFPTEDSLGWLVQEFYFMNILGRCDFALMDIDDFQRYAN